jgi:glutamine synthetase adenylyltransferase
MGSSGKAIRDAYLFFREIENRLSLLGKSGSHGLPQESTALEHLVGCLNFAERHKGSGESRPKWSAESLLKTESEMRSRVREIFESLFSAGFR